MLVQELPAFTIHPPPRVPPEASGQGTDARLLGPPGGPPGLPSRNTPCGSGRWPSPPTTHSQSASVSSSFTGRHREEGGLRGLQHVTSGPGTVPGSPRDLKRVRVGALHVSGGCVPPTAPRAAVSGSRPSGGHLDAPVGDELHVLGLQGQLQAGGLPPGLRHSNEQFLCSLLVLPVALGEDP